MNTNKPKISRKLKKALKQCIRYYDGFFLCIPIDTRRKIRNTKWMHRVIDRYDAIASRPYIEEDELSKTPITKNSAIIDRCISHIYYKEPKKKKKRPTLKEWRRRGYIFTYSRNNVVYPNGAWIPKERPQNQFYKTANLNTKTFSVVHEAYDYKTRSHKVIERVPISKEEFDNKELKLKSLFDTHIDQIIKYDIEIF